MADDSSGGDFSFAYRTVAGKQVDLLGLAGRAVIVVAGSGVAKLTHEEQVAFHLDGGLEQFVEHLASTGPSEDREDGFDALRAQVPDGLSVMLDTTTVENALLALSWRQPSPLVLLDLATLATAMVCFDNVIVQPCRGDVPSPDLGIAVLHQSREVVEGPLWSICADAGNRLVSDDQRRRVLEASWATFLGWPETDTKIDTGAWNEYQDSPSYWDGVVAGYYTSSLADGGPQDHSNAEFLGIQTMRTMVNHELASRLGVPYMAAAIRCPIQSFIIRENHERQMVVDRLIQALGPQAAKPAAPSDEPYSLEYSAPFVLGLVLERMRKPSDFWEIVNDYRRRFSPLREQLRKDRESWDGRVGPYTRQMLRRISTSADLVNQSGQDVVDAGAAFVSGALGGVTGASASLGMKLITLLFQADRTRKCYRRWFRPELYLLSSLRDEANGLRAMDQRVERIWNCRWDSSEYRQLDMLRAANPASFLKLGELQLICKFRINCWKAYNG